MGFTNWQERAEKAEAELAMLRDQKPLTWGTSGELMDILKNPIYSSPAPVPAVPEEWRKVMAELADDLAIEIDQSYPPERRAYPSEQRRYEREMAIVNRARALLQSAEGCSSHSERGAP